MTDTEKLEYATLVRDKTKELHALLHKFPELFGVSNPVNETIKNLRQEASYMICYAQDEIVELCDDLNLYENSSKFFPEEKL